MALIPTLNAEHGYHLEYGIPKSISSEFINKPTVNSIPKFYNTQLKNMLQLPSVQPSSLLFKTINTEDNLKPIFLPHDKIYQQSSFDPTSFVLTETSTISQNIENNNLMMQNDKPMISIVKKITNNIDIVENDEAIYSIDIRS